MKKSISLIIALLMLSGQIMACSQATVDEADNSAAAPNPSTDASDTVSAETDRLDDGLEDADFDGYQYNIFIHATITNDFLGEEITGEPINDAQWERVLTVQDNYNCIIKPQVQTNTNNRTGHKELGTSVEAGTNDYDIACMSAYSSCNALVSGYLMDLNSIPNLDLTKPWWDQNSIEESRILGKNFFATGDISTGDNGATYCIYFNKNMAEMYNMPSFYDMVDNMTWTIDNFRIYAEQVTADLDKDNDGNHVNDPDDVYGIWIWDDIMMGIVNSTGIKCCTIDEEGNITLQLYSEKFVNAFDKFASYAFNKDVTCAYQRNGYAADYGQIAFREGRGLFFMQNLGAAISFREMEDDFGILPLPLYDETQDRYYNSAASWSLSLYTIPKSSHDNEGLARIGTITQALAYESLYTLTPAYYEQTLQNKVSRDVESARMLDLIFATRTYDFGWYFEVGAYNESIMNLLRSYNTDVASMYRMAEKSATKILKKTNEKIKSMIEEFN